MYAARETSRRPPHGGRRRRHPAAPLLLYVLLLVSAQAGGAVPARRPAANNRSASAIFVFGDSTVDPGNNDYIYTVTKSNFPPYGRDFPGAVPTGRFCNGRLATDFIASNLGVKDMVVPPYLDGSLSAEELLTGVSFASAGTGFDPLTAQISGLWALGARRFGVVSLPPMGCLPSVITENALTGGGSLFDRACVPEFDAVSREYNAKLQAFIASFRPAPAANIVYVDIYTPAMQLIHNPAQYGFEEASVGCCGTGLLEVSILCNPKSPTCPDASKYVFWDSVHPTERTNSIVADELRPAVERLLHARLPS